MGQFDGLVAVGGLADHVEALVGQRVRQALPQHAVVVGEHQADGASPRFGRGRGRAEHRVASGVIDQPSPVGAGIALGFPFPGAVSTSSVAPMLDARSRMPRIP